MFFFISPVLNPAGQFMSHSKHIAQMSPLAWHLSVYQMSVWTINRCSLATRSTCNLTCRILKFCSLLIWYLHASCAYNIVAGRRCAAADPSDQRHPSQNSGMDSVVHRYRGRRKAQGAKELMEHNLSHNTIMYWLFSVSLANEEHISSRG